MRIYSDQSYLPPGATHVPILYPFWGCTALEQDQHKNIQAGRFDQYAKVGSSLFEMTSIEDCDLAIFPARWEICRNVRGRELAIAFAKKANQAQKPVVVFVEGDLPEDVPIENAFIFHTSLYRSTKGCAKFAIPASIDDLVSRNFNGILPVRHKQAKPTVGFCGYAPPLGMPLNLKRLKETVRLGLHYLGVTRLAPSLSAHSSRVRALLELSRSPSVQTNFMLNGNSPFAWQCGYLLQNQGSSGIQQSRVDYLNNLMRSDYIICARGTGNYSLRLYEALCCGRIPIFIDTDCVLPYDFHVDWKKYCIWVNESELSSIAEKVIDFHHKLSAQEFLELQYECRKLWKQWLSPEGFLENFYRHFQIGQRVSA